MTNSIENGLGNEPVGALNAYDGAKGVFRAIVVGVAHEGLREITNANYSDKLICGTVVVQRSPYSPHSQFRSEKTFVNFEWRMPLAYSCPQISKDDSIYLEGDLYVKKWKGEDGEWKKSHVLSVVSLKKLEASNV